MAGSATETCYPIEAAPSSRRDACARFRLVVLCLLLVRTQKSREKSANSGVPRHGSIGTRDARNEAARREAR